MDLDAWAKDMKRGLSQHGGAAEYDQPLCESPRRRLLPWANGRVPECSYPRGLLLSLESRPQNCATNLKAFALLL